MRCECQGRCAGLHTEESAWLQSHWDLLIDGLTWYQEVLSKWSLHNINKRLRWHQELSKRFLSLSELRYYSVDKLVGWSFFPSCQQRTCSQSTDKERSRWIRFMRTNDKGHHGCRQRRQHISLTLSQRCRQSRRSLGLKTSECLLWRVLELRLSGSVSLSHKNSM